MNNLYYKYLSDLLSYKKNTYHVEKKRNLTSHLLGYRIITPAGLCEETNKQTRHMKEHKIWPVYT